MPTESIRAAWKNDVKIVVRCTQTNIFEQVCILFVFTAAGVGMHDHIEDSINFADTIEIVLFIQLSALNDIEIEEQFWKDFVNNWNFQIFEIRTKNAGFIQRKYKEFWIHTISSPDNRFIESIPIFE